MAKKKKPEELIYNISDIRELEVHIPLLPEGVANDFDEGKLDYGFTFDYFWNLEEDNFSVVIEVIYVYDREGLNELLLKYVGEVEYYIQGLAKHIDVDNNEIKLPAQFLAILTGICISTVRGMIATRTFGKFQGDFYFPILPPMKIVEDYLQSSNAQPATE